MRSSLCTCGKRADDCVFWGKIASILQENEDLPLDKKYQIVLDTFENVFGKHLIPVDSSKYIESMQILCKNPEVDARVLHLIKDVRSFTISQIDRGTRPGYPSRAKRGTRRTSGYHFWMWYLQNKRIQGFLRKENIQSFQMGYEELCLYPDLVLQKMCDFLGEKMEPSMLCIEASGSHIIRGNRMREQADKRQKILYDHRWFYRNEWILPAAFFPNIMKYNRSQVYNNGTEMIWKR